MDTAGGSSAGADGGPVRACSWFPLWATDRVMWAKGRNRWCSIRSRLHRRFDGIQRCVFAGDSNASI